jgi:hypothetical protein
VLAQIRDEVMTRCRGGIAHAPDAFELDKPHRFERNKLVPFCGNTWRMLTDTRFAPVFEVFGDSATHSGIFEACGEGLPFSADGPAGPEPCC